MSELMSILNTPVFQSKESLKKQLKELGIGKSSRIMVHSSLMSMGWIAGGAQAVVEALMETVTESGTIVMPSQSADNSDPVYWMEPPIPENWHKELRQKLPAYDPYLSPLRGMGKIAECFHRHPDTIRSAHPAHSLMAWGKDAELWMCDHPLDDSFGAGSPLAKMMDADVQILLIGVGFDTCTALHYAEYAQDHRTTSPQGAAITRNGQRVWQRFECVDMDSDRFPDIAKDYPDEIKISQLGQAEVKLVYMRPLVEFGIEWLQKNKKQ
ncbi:aminoglycoside N(3)-acetyltransferase [Metaplanococcus flavidus]|uniref:Aminoglycoside N(3)-acetyltransferase n=1 Tax=Metaplanococcus flavidus TaxID=569883 RepID=A0ABW3L7F7_9BACL